MYGQPAGNASNENSLLNGINDFPVSPQHKTMLNPRVLFILLCICMAALTWDGFGGVMVVWCCVGGLVEIGKREFQRWRHSAAARSHKESAQSVCGPASPR